MNFLVSDKSQEVAAFLFENIRNTLICATVAGSTVFIGKKHPNLFIFGSKYAEVITLVILFTVVALFMWSLIITVVKILDLHKEFSIRNVGLLVVAAIPYSLFILLVFSAVVGVSSQK